MARDFFINGPTMVYVKGSQSCPIASLTELGLASDAIRVQLDFKHKDINMDAWGEVAAEVQFMLAGANISISLIDFDRSILDICLQQSMGGTPAIGTMPITGARLGNGAARFANANHFIGLNLSSPVGNKPWCFMYAYMTGTPIDFPLGTEKSIVQTNWRAIPYDTNYYNAGNAAYGLPLWTHILDT